MLRRPGAAAECQPRGTPARAVGIWDVRLRLGSGSPGFHGPQLARDSARAPGRAAAE
jgi:hypothetical protein